MTAFLLARPRRARLRRTAAAVTVALSALAGAGAAGAAATPFFPPFGLDLTAQDKTTRPQDDFFQYANGAWLARTPIPPDQPSVSMGRDVFDRVQARLHALLDAAAASAPATPVTDEQKVGAMYAAFMDSARIEALGAAPIQPPIDAIRAA